MNKNYLNLDWVITMKKITSKLFIIITIAATASALFINCNKSSKQSENDNKINLFNGQNLDGWYTFLKDQGKNNDVKKVFTVRDGMIQISGEEYGCITTMKEYHNYHLIAEFKWGTRTFAPRIDKARDSGILLHSTGEDGAFAGTWMHSIECQIIEGGTGDLLVVGDGSERFSLTSPVAAEKQGESYIFQSSGNPATIYKGRIDRLGRDPNWRDVKGFRDPNGFEKPVGEWNRLECIVNNGQIEIILNGTLVNSAIKTKPQKGRIQIQSESAEIFFRKIELLPIKN